MAGTTVDTEALDQVAGALSTYINDVNSCITRMKTAATDCSDNMGNDVYSQRAIANLNSCVSELQKALLEAGELRQKIINKKNAIEDSVEGF